MVMLLVACEKGKHHSHARTSRMMMMCWFLVWLKRILDDELIASRGTMTSFNGTIEVPSKTKEISNHVDAVYSMLSPH